MSFIDKILNKITMYRLALYYVIFLVLVAAVLGTVGHVPYGPVAVIFSAVYITLACLAVNAAFAYFFEAPANPESVYITALILTLIIAPIHSPTDILFFALATWTSIWAMASKYILAIGKKHIFNPAAIAVVITAFSVGLSANWWVGTVWMLPFVAVGGLLVVRKLQRFKMMGSFVAAALVVVLIHHPAVVTIWKALAETPLIFFACIMLTEPLTAPSTQKMRIVYGVLVGLLFAPFVHIGSVYSTPELALVVGNVFAFIVVSPKKKFVLKLREKNQVAAGTFEFWFDEAGKNSRTEKGTRLGNLKFHPGQYLEWTLEPKLGTLEKSDSSKKSSQYPALQSALAGFLRIFFNIFSADNRGIRRYFTIASSPGEAAEKGIAIGVKFYGQVAGGSEQSSTFKKVLMAMKPGDTIVASGLAGDFVVPKKVSEKANSKGEPKDTTKATSDQRIVMMAGGIGITPFRSMVQDLLDRNEQRPIRIIYSNRTAADIAYREIFDEARKRLGIKTVYTLTDTNSSANPNAIPAGWRGRRGFVDAKMIEEEVPGYMNCLFYISGPRAMVTAYENILFDMGVPGVQIKKDFFPGFV
jgi:ferredoxin-NADP reductase/Na+-translocating ferredoxin:NAD+ oxidoreductase RnfD subunit